MAYDILLKEAKDFPEDMIEQFIRFLKYASMQKQAEHTANDTATFQRSINPLAGEFVSIADDFDETPECFKEHSCNSEIMPIE